MYVQAVEEVLVDTGQISLPFLDDYFIPFSVILHRSLAVAKHKAPIVTSLTEKKPIILLARNCLLKELDDFSVLC